METQKVDQFCHSRGEIYNEIDLPCVKCGHKEDQHRTVKVTKDYRGGSKDSE